MVLLVVGACDTPHALMECGATLPCPDGMECSSDGICVVMNPYDASTDARPILRDAAPPPDAEPTPDAEAPADAALSECGDGWCQFGFEDCTTCEFDCDTCPGTCGDDRCDDIERCWICPGDCGACTGCDHTVCEIGPALLETCADPCIDLVCAVDPECCGSEWDAGCVSTADFVCLAHCTEPVCGNGVCETENGETCFNCGADCNCGCTHEVCSEGEALLPECGTCVAAVCAEIPSCCTTVWDRPCIDRMTETCYGVCDGFCGDGLCAPSEFCEPVFPGPEWPPPWCTVDCGCDVCGDGVCRPRFDEFCWSCPGDCGDCPVECGDGTCAATETCDACPADCGACPTCSHDVCAEGAALENGCSTCVGTVCTADPFCCATAWDDRCVGEAETLCAVDCGTACGDATCDPGETCTSCPADCGPCLPTCGDGSCTGTEVCFTCPADCGPCLPACGDGACIFTQGEFCLTCPADCGPCP